MSDSNDPHVKAVWEMMARAKVAHDLARENKRVDRTVARGHAHTAIKNMVRAAEYAKKHFTMPEQRARVVGIESQFSPVLFRCMHAAFPKPLVGEAALRGGATNEDVAAKLETFLEPIRTTKESIATTRAAIAGIVKKSEETAAAILTAKEETLRRETWQKAVTERIKEVKHAREKLDITRSILKDQTEKISDITDPLTYVQRARTNIFDSYIAREWRDIDPKTRDLRRNELMEAVLKSKKVNIFGETWGSSYPPIDPKLAGVYNKDPEKEGSHQSVLKHICTIGRGDIDISDLLQKIVVLQSWYGEIDNEIKRHSVYLETCKLQDTENGPTPFEQTSVDSDVKRAADDISVDLEKIATKNGSTLQLQTGTELTPLGHKYRYGNLVVEDMSRSIRI